MITFKSKKDVASVEAIFSEINARMIAALMFHDQMSDYFDFLWMKGYKKLHEYQYFAESLERKKLNQYYINHHGKLIPDTYSGQISMIPENWQSANRISVGKSTKQKGIEDGFNQYHGWESETKNLYEHYSSRLREMGAVADAIMVEKLVEDVDKELKKLERIIIDLISSGYDMIYITESQQCLHDTYKKKLCEIFDWEVKK
nr:MAG TPA: hypothetical protein [Bacteriophage sp.]